jgi:hypothetical protein
LSVTEAVKLFLPFDLFNDALSTALDLGSLTEYSDLKFCICAQVVIVCTVMSRVSDKYNTVKYITFRGA